MNLDNIKSVYFVGIGGIGMSAIARYFLHKGMTVGGYDKTPSDLTKKLQEEGARNVLISMAGEGAVFISEKGDVMKSEAPKGTVVNSVGAGDSMVAGFVTGMIESNDYMTAFRMGLCTGSASAFSPDLATRPEVEALLEKLPPIE